MNITSSNVQRPLDLSAAAAVPTQHDRIVTQAEKWVAQTFFGTLLKQMEESPFRSDLFSGGRGGQAFSSMLHQQLSERMAHGVGDKLVKSIARRIEATSAYQKHRPAAASTEIPQAPTSQRGSSSNGNDRSSGRRHVAAAA